MAGTGTELLGFGDAQRYLGVSRSTLLRWLESGKVKGYKAGKKWKFRREELERALVPATPGEEPAPPTVREPAAQYAAREVTPRAVIKELHTHDFLPSALTPRALDEGVWTAWQDSEQWLWIACVRGPHGVRLDKRLPGAPLPRSIALSPAAATAVLASWQDWQRGATTTTRPGSISVITGGGREITVLRVPAHVDVLPSWDRLCADPALQATVDNAIAAGAGDWLVAGPAGRAPATAAYALARTLAFMLGDDPTVVTGEHDPSYYWPGAIQRYGRGENSVAGGVTLCLQALTYEDIAVPRRAGSPAFRVGYCVEAGDELPFYPGAHVVSVTATDTGLNCRLMEQA